MNEPWYERDGKKIRLGETFRYPPEFRRGFEEIKRITTDGKDPWIVPLELNTADALMLEKRRYSLHPGTQVLGGFLWACNENVQDVYRVAYASKTMPSVVTARAKQDRRLKAQSEAMMRRAERGNSGGQRSGIAAFADVAMPFLRATADTMSQHYAAQAQHAREMTRARTRQYAVAEAQRRQMGREDIMNPGPAQEASRTTHGENRAPVSGSEAGAGGAVNQVASGSPPATQTQQGAVDSPTTATSNSRPPDAYVVTWQDEKGVWRSFGPAGFRKGSSEQAALKEAYSEEHGASQQRWWELTMEGGQGYSDSERQPRFIAAETGLRLGRADVVGVGVDKSAPRVSYRKYVLLGYGSSADYVDVGNYEGRDPMQLLGLEYPRN
jgi:hypothetical protein